MQDNDKEYPTSVRGGTYQSLVNSQSCDHEPFDLAQATLHILELYALLIVWIVLSTIAGPAGFSTIRLPALFF